MAADLWSPEQNSVPPSLISNSKYFGKLVWSCITLRTCRVMQAQEENECITKKANGSGVALQNDPLVQRHVSWGEIDAMNRNRNGVEQ